MAPQEPDHASTEPAQPITHAQAAALLGCHPSNVAKLVKKGQLTSTGMRGPGVGTLDLEEVVQLREERIKAEQERRLRYDRVDPRPQGPPAELGDHEWLTPDQVGQRLGITGTSVRFRAARGTIPHVRHGKRIWIRADHLELWRRSRPTSVNRQPHPDKIRKGEAPRVLRIYVPHMTLRLRTACALTVLGTIVSGCGGGSTPEAAKPSVTPTTTLSAEPEPTEDASPTAVPPNVGDRALRVGQTREGLAASMTLQEIRFPYPPAEYREPQNPGDRFLGLRIRQCAKENFDPAQYGNGEPFYSSYNGEWTAASPGGEQIAGSGSSWNDWPRPKFPENVTLNPGDCIKGWVVMEVPANYKIEKMIWRPGGETTAEWLP